MKPTLYLMAGYPGAGKTHTAEIISQLSGAVHLSSDKIRTELFTKPTFDQAEHDQLYKEIDTQTEKLLAQGKSVIYDANLNRYQHRQEKYDICKRTKANPVLVWVETSKSVAKNRATHESRSHLVPKTETAEAMFERIAEIIEPPQEHEPTVKITGENITPAIVKEKLHL